ncbi:MAG: helical backbone metal receptor [bacterium]|nr:helical backbone metal receptor [bacterium]
MSSSVRRIVSLVPSTTESVVALGAGDRLVGCTRYCTEPGEDLVTVARVGGTKNPKLEAIAELEPDLVLVNAEENELGHIAWLRARFPVLQQTPRTVAEAAAELRELALHLDAMATVQPFLLRIEAQLAAAEVARLERPAPRAFYAIWRKPWMSINGDTFIHDVLRVAGAINICEATSDRYPEAAPERLVSAGVDLVLLPSEPWEFDAEQRDELRARRTFGDATVVLCDGRDFCWHGVRMADGIGNAVEVIARAAGGSDPV